MTLFIKQYLGFILLYTLNFTVLLGIFLLEEHTLTIAQYLYFVLLSSFFLGAFIWHSYARDKGMYTLASKNKMSSEFAKMGTSPLAKQLEQELANMHMMHMDELNVAKRQYSQYLTFIDRWVHSLKTPLSVLKLIFRENEENVLVPNIEQETDRILAGLNTALYYARSEDMVKDLCFTNLSLKDAVKNVVNELKRWFIRSEVFPVVDIDKNIRFSTDAKWLHFIVFQLLTNAIKYADKENARVTITFEKGNMVIEDNGMGIPKKDIPRVFNRFFTGDNGRKRGESTGIGLFLVKQVCDRLNYPLQLESEQGVGCKISIGLVKA